MKILAISKLRPGTTREMIKPLQKSEAETAWNLYTNGKIRELYFCTEPPSAILIMESDDLAAIRP